MWRAKRLFYKNYYADKYHSPEYCKRSKASIQTRSISFLLTKLLQQQKRLKPNVC